MPGKLIVKSVLAERFLIGDWFSKFQGADLPKYVPNERLIMEQLHLRQRLYLLDFCTGLRIA